MTLEEFSLWRSFYISEPWGDVRADLRAGIVATVMAKTMGGAKNATPMDFMPIVKRQQDSYEPRQMTVEETMSAWADGVRAAGGEFHDYGRG